MALTVEAAVVTKKGPANPFNTDSVNAAGKVWPAEIIHGEKGVRVAGTNKGSPYYVLASSKTKGTAQSAADLFQNCVDKFNEDGSNCALMLSEYFNAFAKVLIESGFESSDCSFAVLAGFNDTVYVGKSGDSRLYTFCDEAFSEISPESKPFSDGKSSFGVAQCNAVKAGDLFILLPGAVASVFPDGLLKAACIKFGGDVRKIAAVIGSQAEKYGYHDAVSSVVVRVTEVELPVIVPAADAKNIDIADENEALKNNESPAAEEETPEDIAAALSAAAAEKEAIGEGDEGAYVEENNAAPVKKGKRAGIVVLLIVIALAVLAVLYFFVSGASQKYFGNRETTTASETETETETESESTTEAETAEDPATVESTTEETTAAPETTTQRRENTTRAPQTTRAPETQAPTEPDSTEAPETQETAENTEPTGNSDPTENSTPTENNEPTGNSEPSESNEPSENTESNELSSNSGSPEETSGSETNEENG